MIGIYAGRLTDNLLEDLKAEQIVSIQYLKTQPKQVIVVATTEVTLDALRIIEAHYPDIPKTLLVEDTRAAMYQEWLQGFVNWKIYTQPIIKLRSILQIAEG